MKKQDKIFTGRVKVITPKGTKKYTTRFIETEKHYKSQQRELFNKEGLLIVCGQPSCREQIILSSLAPIPDSGIPGSHSMHPMKYVGQVTKYIPQKGRKAVGWREFRETKNYFIDPDGIRFLKRTGECMDDTELSIDKESIQPWRQIYD